MRQEGPEVPGGVSLDVSSDNFCTRISRSNAGTGRRCLHACRRDFAAVSEKNMIEFMETTDHCILTGAFRAILTYGLTGL